MWGRVKNSAAADGRRASGAAAEHCTPLQQWHAWGATHDVFDVLVCTALQQQPHALELAPVSSNVQRCPAFLRATAHSE
jgi:hypothetical protein